MRKPLPVLIGVALLAALLFGVTRFHRATSPPETVTASLPDTPPETSVPEAAPTAVPEPAPEVAAALPPEPAPAEPVPVDPAPVAAVPEPVLPELPLRVVKERPAHTVPEVETPAPSKSLGFKDPPRSGNPPPLPAGPIIGKAEVAGSTELKVAGRTVELFGIRPPETGARCIRGDGTAPCAEMAKVYLAARLKANADVNCRVPIARPGQIAAGICLDSTGVDLGGALIGEGLALANTSQSYDYYGAEGIARSFRKGLWATR